MSDIRPDKLGGSPFNRDGREARPRMSISNILGAQKRGEAQTTVSSVHLQFSPLPLLKIRLPCVVFWPASCIQGFLGKFC